MSASVLVHEVVPRDVGECLRGQAAAEWKVSDLSVDPSRHVSLTSRFNVGASRLSIDGEGDVDAVEGYDQVIRTPDLLKDLDDAGLTVSVRQLGQDVSGSGRTNVLIFQTNASWLTEYRLYRPPLVNASCVRPFPNGSIEPTHLKL